MSTGSPKRIRGRRVTSVELPPGLWRNLWGHLRRGPVLLRLALCGLAAVALWLITQGWIPPQEYRKGQIPHRNVTARIAFEQYDPAATAEARDRARKLAVAIYEQDKSQLVQLRARLENDVSQLLGAEKLDDVADLWASFQPPLAEGTPPPTDEERQEQFKRFREALDGEEKFEAFKAALAEVFAPLERDGLLDALPPEHDANFERIAVRPIGSESFETPIPVRNVLVSEVTAQLQKALDQKMPSLDVARRVFAWLRPQLPVTLKLAVDATEREQEKAAEAVPEQMKMISRGDVLAVAGKPIDEPTLATLNLEYQAMVEALPTSALVARSFATLGMYVALYTLCGFYIYHRERRIILELGRLVTLLLLVVLVVGLVVASPDEWRAEITPLLLFAMTMAIAYQQELALLLSASVTLVAVVALGQGLPQALVWMATVAGAILVLRNVRTRSKLLTVSFVAAVVAFLTTLGVGTLDGQPFMPMLRSALLIALWCVISGSLMTCLLPLVERVFGVQTDLSLIELGDPAHPLLQELIRRAPGTYNHSITVASLAESAAEAIGARGLLVRVGAYFHDIGKMLKPGYFVENQGQGDNRHQSLLPAMSTLVIIAHVKDGADLARQNKLPQPIIDFIQQHHGTTLVEYFYRQASQQQSDAKDGKELDESTFRYPGPKPQTKEAGVLMLADAVESASRVLVEPTPARIESLVEELCRKRLLDGQFDECGLTLEEVHKIGDSLVKSLTAVYHGRVKYPDQETA